MAGEKGTAGAGITGFGGCSCLGCWRDGSSAGVAADRFGLDAGTPTGFGSGSCALRTVTVATKTIAPKQSRKELIVAALAPRD